jgi:hypothetical protein
MAKHGKTSPDPSNNKVHAFDPQDGSAKSPTDEAAAWFWPKLKRTRTGRIVALGVVALAVLAWLTGLCYAKIPSSFEV